MAPVFSSIVFFVIAIGVLVTVHEFGHFWVARKSGVKVLRFSVGFGKPLFIWKGRNGETEYAIAAIPLGGYVRMLDEREGHVETHELQRAFNRKPVSKRFAIVLAGPLFNFLLAIIAYWSIYMIGIPGIKPLVGQVEEGSLAYQGGFRYGDEITRIDDVDIATWENAYLTLMEKSLDREPVTVTVRDESRQLRQRVLDFRADFNRDNFLEDIGIMRYRPRIPPVIDQVVAGEAAASAGLQPGDLIVSADEQQISDWEEWVEYVRARPRQAILVTVERDGVQRHLTITPGEYQSDGGAIGRIGAAVRIPEQAADRLAVTVRYGPLQGLGAAVEKTWHMSWLTLRMLGSMLFGEVSVSSISGPISIAQYAGSTANAGLVPYLSFLALISISLGVLNLLPIPVLDGGHLFYYVVEIIKGSPLSEEMQQAGQRIGIALLIGLMVLAFYNDIVRFFR